MVSNKMHPEWLYQWLQDLSMLLPLMYLLDINGIMLFANNLKFTTTSFNIKDYVHILQLDVPTKLLVTN